MTATKLKSKSKIIEFVIWMIVLILLWELACWAKLIPKYIMPSPSDVFCRALLSFKVLTHHLSETLYAVIIGFFVGAVIGIGLAIVMAQNEHLYAVFQPIIVFSRAIPQSALVPFYVLLFGYGLFPEIVVTILITFFPMLINTISGLTIVDPELLDLMHSLSASKLQILTKIQLPGSLPYIFSGLKISGPDAVIGVVTAEFIVGTAGLGYLVQVAVRMVDLPLVFVAISCMAIIGFVMFGAPTIVEKWLAPWYKGR